MESAGNTYPARAVLYLFNLLRGLYPDIDFILDWENSLPNAYSWAQWGRRTVVITGGMARLKDLRRDGLAIVVSAMIAYQFPDVRCVGEADYTAIALVMHDLWDGDLFVSVLRSGLPAIEKIFSYISPDHSQPDPDNPCQVPGIACRLDSYNAGRSSLPMPECAQPKPATSKSGTRGHSPLRPFRSPSAAPSTSRRPSRQKTTNSSRPLTSDRPRSIRTSPRRSYCRSASWHPRPATWYTSPAS